MKFIFVFLFGFIYSIALSQNSCDTINVPNSFTPTFEKNNKFYPIVDCEYKVNIYNRWGNLIFTGKEWDGTYKNIPCDNGSYIWVITIYGEEEKIFNGVINLIK